MALSDPIVSGPRRVCRRNPLGLQDFGRRVRTKARSMAAVFGSAASLSGLGGRTPDIGGAEAAKIHRVALIHVEKVRSQFLSLRQPVQALCSPGQTRSQASPEAVAISNLSSRLSTGRTGVLFSEAPISLRTSGLHPFGTVLEIRSCRVTYEPRRKVIF
jgi:hypothetical protein